MSIELVDPIVFSERRHVADAQVETWAIPLGRAEAIWESGVSYFDDGIKRCLITELEAGYDVAMPIPVTIERTDDYTYQASFDEANVAISGVDAHDAYQGLIAEILDTFDTLVREPRLSPAPAAQLDVLRRYIVQT